MILRLAFALAFIAGIIINLYTQFEIHKGKRSSKI